MKRNVKLLVAAASLVALVAGLAGQAVAAGGTDDSLGVPGGAKAPGSPEIAGNCDTLDPLWTLVVQSKRAVKYNCLPNVNITDWSLTTEDRYTFTARNDSLGMFSAPGGKSYDFSTSTDGIRDSFHASWTVSGKIPATPADFAPSVTPGAVPKTGEVQGALFLMWMQLPRIQNANLPIADTRDCQSYVKEGPFLTGNDQYVVLEWSISLTPDQKIGTIRTNPPPDPLSNTNLLVRRDVGIARYFPTELLLSTVLANYDVETNKPRESPATQLRCETTATTEGGVTTYQYLPVRDTQNVPINFSDPGTLGVNTWIDGPGGNTLHLVIPFVFHTYGGTNNQGTTRILAEPGHPVEKVFPVVQALVNVWDVPETWYPECIGGSGNADPDCTQTGGRVPPTINDPRAGKPPILKPGQTLRRGTFLKANPYVDWALGTAFDLGTFSGSLTFGAESVENGQCPTYTGLDVKSALAKDADNIFQANPLFDANLLDGPHGLKHFDSTGINRSHVNGPETPMIPVSTSFTAGALKTQDDFGALDCTERIPTAQQNKGNPVSFNFVA